MQAGASFRERLLQAGLLLETGVDGLYGRSGAYEAVVAALDTLVTRSGRHQAAEVMRFPPGSSRASFERSGYLNGFPHLAGTVHCFCGDERAHRDLLRRVDGGEDWTGGQEASDIVLTPAACYPVYPVLAARGPLGQGGTVVDVASWCFRREPSIEPTRMQMFRMREYVRIGEPGAVLAFRQEWLDRMVALMGWLGLPCTVDVANDPFFGRTGRLKADSQRERELKFELLIPINDKAGNDEAGNDEAGNDGAGPTACTSFNYHLDHFAQTCGLRLADGTLPHSGCIGFGMDRLTLALFRHHGLRPGDWPPDVRRVLWP